MVNLTTTKYYTLKEIADLLQMHINSIRLYVKEGKMKAFKVGKGYLVAEEDLRAFIERKSNDC